MGKIKRKASLAVMAIQPLPLWKFFTSWMIFFCVIGVWSTAFSWGLIDSPNAVFYASRLASAYVGYVFIFIGLAVAYKHSLIGRFLYSIWGNQVWIAWFFSGFYIAGTVTNTWFGNYWMIWALLVQLVLFFGVAYWYAKKIDMPVFLQTSENLFKDPIAWRKQRCTIMFSGETIPQEIDNIIYGIMIAPGIICIAVSTAFSRSHQDIGIPLLALGGSNIIAMCLYPSFCYAILLARYLRNKSEYGNLLADKL